MLLLEQGRLTSGSTWHAAGLVGQLRTSANITQLLGYSVELYDRLEAETGQATGWKRNGGLRLACTADRWTEVRRQATTAHSFGLEMHLLTAQGGAGALAADDRRRRGRCRLPADRRAGQSRRHHPGPGQGCPHGRGHAARGRGGDRLRAGAGPGARRADHGRAGSPARRWCCAPASGPGHWPPWPGSTCRWSRSSTSTSSPRPIPGVTPGLPTLRDPDRLTYYKEEVGGLVMGGYEPNPKPWAERGLPERFEFQLLGEDWDHFEPIMELALGRVPALGTAGVKQLINGPESFTPDGNWIIGEAPGDQGHLRRRRLQRLRHRLGRRGGHGAGRVGGQGRAAVRRLAGRHPPLRPRPPGHGLGPHPHAGSLRQALRHGLAVRGVPFAAGRCAARRSVAAAQGPGRLLRREAGLGAAQLVRRPRRGAGRRATASAAPTGSTAVGREHRACREAGCLFDQTSFAKFLLVGRDAEPALSWLCANDVAKPPGSLTYTQLLNARGGIECDLTVARLAQDRFYLVTGTGFATHDFDWIARHIPDGLDAHLVDGTSAHAVLSLFGPQGARGAGRGHRTTRSTTPPSRSRPGGACGSPAPRSWRCA